MVQKGFRRIIGYSKKERILQQTIKVFIMEELEVVKIDSDDLEDLVIQMEKSFEIKFVDFEIKNFTTIDELSDMVISKMEYNEGRECSSQMVFYQLRQTISDKTTFNKELLKPDTELNELFPSKGRRKKWKQVFSGFYLEVPELGANDIIFFLIIVAFISIFFMFSRFFVYAISVFMLCSIIIYLFVRFANTLPCKTLGDLSKYIVKYNYIKTREEIKTINIEEVKDIVYNYITECLVVEEGKKITMNTKLDHS